MLGRIKECGFLSVGWLAPAIRAAMATRCRPLHPLVREFKANQQSKTEADQ